MDSIIIKDLEALACHGVNPEEKINKQRFLFSVELDEDFEEAAFRDDVDYTVSYAAVKKYIQAFCEGNCFDLIETLAARLAENILIEFPRANAIELTVKKPDAPMSGKFDYVAVRVKRKRTRVYLALGSSEGDRNGYLDLAIDSLKGDKHFTNVKESGRLLTQPYGGVAKGEFLNSVVECDTVYAPAKLLEALQSIEKEGGRVRKERWGDRTLDIDIIFFVDEVVGSADLCVPHPDMQNRLFVLEPLAELCPNKLHPLLKKRVRDLLAEASARA